MVTEAISRLHELSTLNAVHDALNRNPDFSVGLQAALDALVEAVDVTTGWVFTITGGEGDVHASGLRLLASTGLPPALEAGDRAALRCDSCECQGLFARKKLDRGINIVTCSRLASADGDRGELQIHASVPLLSPRGPVGILNLAAPGARRFDSDVLSFLAAAGKAIGTSFERDRLQSARTDAAQWAAVLEERQRLAQDMHDSLSQLLFAADLSVAAARKGQNAAGESGPLEHAAEILTAAQAELRALVEVLRVPDVSGGLRAALTRLAERTRPALDTHVKVDDVGAMADAPHVADALYRIAQEALHNSMRHARATVASVELHEHAGRLELIVSDDGIGFDTSSPTGLGIRGMRQRAAEIGAEFELVSESARGTRVRVRVSNAEGER